VEKHIKIVKEIGQTLFNNGADSLSRRHALTHSTLFADSNPGRFPQGLQYFIIILDDFKTHLITHYKQHTPMEREDRSFFTPDVHRQFGELFENAIESLQNDKTELWPWDHITNHVNYLKGNR
jgi:hypothetical protein